MPITIFNWNEPASRPRICAGAISEIYMGPTTELAPTANPPTSRKKINSDQMGDKAQPMALHRYNKAMTKSTFLRPYTCAGLPATSEPITVPIRLEATVKPCHPELSDQSCWMVFSAPEITAVSNPKRNPPVPQSLTREGHS